MKPHNWIVKEFDGNHMGVYDAWHCEGCGASGGILFYTKYDKPWMCKFIGYPVETIDLPPDDCDLAKRMIDEHLQK